MWVILSWTSDLVSVDLTTLKSAVVAATMAVEAEAATEAAAAVAAMVEEAVRCLRFLPDDLDVAPLVFLPADVLVDAAAPPFFLTPPLDLTGFFDPVDPVLVAFFFLALSAAAVLAALVLTGRALAAAGGPLATLASFFLALVFAMVAVSFGYFTLL